MKLELEPCVPPSWARGGHAQTILAHLLPSFTPLPPSERIEMRLTDGDRLVARRHRGESGITVYLFHGLGGDIDESGMRRAAAALLGLGHEVYRMNHRGCGEGRGLARRPYHSGSAEDLSEMIAFGRARRPSNRHIAIGFSLSGNALLLLLAGARGTVPPDAGIAVNAPIDLHDGARRLGAGLNRLYDMRFVLRLRRELRRRYLAGLLDRQVRVPLLAGLRGLDALYTAPAAGFRDREDYYARCSTHARLDRIQAPTIILTAHDDPFVSFEAYRRARLPPSVHLHAEPHGGHMGYLSRARHPLRVRRWLYDALGVCVATLAGEL